MRASRRRGRAQRASPGAGTGPSAPPLAVPDLAVCAAIAVALLALYAATMPRTVTLEDSGLFITTAHLLGIAHPPGYPLYTMLGKGFSLLPFGSVALRLHLMSAGFAALACCFVYLCGWALLRDRVAAAAAALLYGVSRTFWWQALVAEVYTLHAAFFFAILWLCLRWRAAREPRWLYAAAFVAGLSLTNHWPLIVLAAGAYVALLWDDARAIATRAHWVAVSFLAGLLPYAYLMIRSRFAPEITAFTPILTLDELWWNVSRRAYTDQMRQSPTPAGLADTAAFLGAFARQWLRDFTVAGCVVSLLGLVALPRVMPLRAVVALAWALASSSLLLLAVFRTAYDGLSDEMYRVYQLVPMGVVALAIAAALRWLGDRAGVRRLPARAVTSGVAVVLVAACLWANGRRNHLAGETFAHDFAESLLASLPADAVLFLNDAEELGPVVYTNKVAGVRRDVALYTQNGFFLSNRLYDAGTDPAVMAARIDRFMAGRPTIYAASLNDRLAGHFKERYQLEDNGLYFRISARALPPTDRAPLADRAAALLDRELAGGYGSTWEALRRQIVARLCRTLLVAGRRHPIMATQENCQVGLARAAFEAAAWPEAAERYGALLDRIPQAVFSLEEQYQIYQHYLYSQTQVINASDDGADVQRRRYQEMVDRVLPGIHLSSRCENQIVQYLLGIASQIAVELPLDDIRARFAHCRDVWERG